MGLMDHRKTWQFELKAAPDRCLTAFDVALNGRSAFSMRKARWDVRRTTSGAGLPAAVGTYAGRDGAAALLMTFAGRSIAEDDQAAIGSEISFEVRAHDRSTGRTKCAMWLSRRGVRMVDFTAQAGFLRASMKDVASKLAELDSSVTVTKI
ncbi:hypothetical protein ACGFI9_02255 [Micromonospora sp. NPDC048930]|uniref:hypothetical protein n=1 Tax=Micromonospora sp. NPDC048930 TaxID=3364261 RepID=UPI003717AC38